MINTNETLTRLLQVCDVATQTNWTLDHPKMGFNKNDIIADCDHCNEEPFVLAQLNRHMDKWKEDATYIATFNPATMKLLLGALNKSIEDLIMISKNTCCDQCQEAAKVSKSTLASVDEKLKGIK